MKRSVLALLSIACLISGVASAADKMVGAGSSAEKFYGKITSIDHAQKNLTAHNARRQVDADFKWDDQTGLTFNKKPIAPTELKVGQSLMISYISENDLNKATRIMVRTPFKKKALNP